MTVTEVGSVLFSTFQFYRQHRHSCTMQHALCAFTVSQPRTAQTLRAGEPKLAEWLSYFCGSTRCWSADQPAPVISPMMCMALALTLSPHVQLH